MTNTKKAITTILTFLCLFNLLACTTPTKTQSAGASLPKPTSTPVFSGTPAPAFRSVSVDAKCNPFWDNSRSINLNIANSEKEAEKILFTELNRWTRVVQVGKGNTLYLTYLSTQVIEAIVVYTATQRKLSNADRQSLLIEYERRLQLNNSMAFLLLINTQPGGWWWGHIPLELKPLEQTMALINQRRQRFSPYLEYTQVLIEPYSIRGNSVQGYVLFPRNVGNNECTPTVNLLEDHSFDVRLESTHYSDNKDSALEPIQLSYTLLPDIPLERAMKIPLPSKVSELDLKTMNDILGLALTIFQVLTAF